MTKEAPLASDHPELPEDNNWEARRPLELSITPLGGEGVMLEDIDIVSILTGPDQIAEADGGRWPTDTCPESCQGSCVESCKGTCWGPRC